MKHFLAVALLLCPLFSCKKESKKLIFERETVETSCGDLSDDFTFDPIDTSAWYAESVFAGVTFSAIENVTSFDDVYTTSHYHSDTSEDVTFYWKQNRTAHVYVVVVKGREVIMPLHANNQAEVLTGFSISASFRHPGSPLKATPGCYRVFYVLANSNKVTETMGHFDFEVIE